MQPRKVMYSIVVTDLGMVISVKLVQLEKAPAPIVVTDSFISTFFILLVEEWITGINASARILVYPVIITVKSSSESDVILLSTSFLVNVPVPLNSIVVII